MKKLVLLGMAALFVASTPGAATPGQGQGEGKHGEKASKHDLQDYHGGAGRVGNSDGGRYYAAARQGNCPPGLAKKGNGCLSPGQAKKMFNVGQRYNRDLGDSWTYNQIPDRLRTQYALDRNAHYYYNDGYLYQVDPKTMLIRQAIIALLR